MTTKEKAKAYDEALERFKSFKEKYYTKDTDLGDVIFDKTGKMQKDFDGIFPELHKQEKPLTAFQQYLNLVLHKVYYVSIPGKTQDVDKFILDTVKRHTDELVELAKRHEHTDCQLNENEDERIRKYLIEELKAAKSVGELKFIIPQPTREECIAYLEKQKYDRMKPIYDARESFESALEKAWNDYHNGYENVDKLEDDYVECAHAKGFREGYLFGIEKQKDAFENGRQLGIMQEQARQELGWPDEKKKEHQNNSDAPEKALGRDLISPKDKDKNLDEIAQDYVDGVKEYNPEPTWDLIQTAVCYGYHYCEQKEQKPDDDPLDDPKFLKGFDTGREVQRIFDEQKPAEWSDEDKAHVESLLKRLDGMCKKGATFTQTRFAVSEDIDWLKSLRPSWKPSEWQMSMLLAVINDPNNAGSESCYLALKSIYEQLKKLM